MFNCRAYSSYFRQAVTLSVAATAVCLYSPVSGADAAQSRIASLSFGQLAAARMPQDGRIDVAAFSAQLPAEERSAVGQPVRLTGYMLPVVIEQGGVRQFLILRNQMGCCYGQMPAANEYIVASVVGRPIPAVMDTPLQFSGTFKIAPNVVDGVAVTIFALEQSQVSPLP
jgi:hypothetical protein